MNSIGKPLPGRTTVVVTRNPEYAAPGVIAANSLQAAISACGDDDDIFVIGGAELYLQAIALADRIYLTEIDADISGDAYFPEFRLDEWVELSRDQHSQLEPQPLQFDFVVYQRKDGHRNDGRRKDR